jgi:hypothetical protein
MKGVMRRVAASVLAGPLAYLCPVGWQGFGLLVRSTLGVRRHGREPHSRTGMPAARMRSFASRTL